MPHLDGRCTGQHTSTSGMEACGPRVSPPPPLARATPKCQKVPETIPTVAPTRARLSQSGGCRVMHFGGGGRFPAPENGEPKSKPNPKPVLCLINGSRVWQRRRGVAEGEDGHLRRPQAKANADAKACGPASAAAPGSVPAPKPMGPREWRPHPTPLASAGTQTKGAVARNTPPGISCAAAPSGSHSAGHAAPSSSAGALSVLLLGISALGGTSPGRPSYSKRLAWPGGAQASASNVPSILDLPQTESPVGLTEDYMQPMLHTFDDCCALGLECALDSCAVVQGYARPCFG